MYASGLPQVATSETEQQVIGPHLELRYISDDPLFVLVATYRWREDAVERGE
jgi:hypothetical protein